MRHSTPALLPLAASAAIFFGLAGCTTEKIVFQNRDPFNPPPDASSGFLGYFDAPTKTTTCGNCHVGTQAQWETTAHADAYATLTGSGFAAPSCYGCHTVSARGNSTVAPAGWDKVQSAAYHDVQCESCHGPGLDHVITPDNSATWPLAHLVIDTTSATTLKQSCGGCHSGAHNPFIEEWSKSAHGQVVASPASNPSCVSCHEARGTLIAWGVLPASNFVEKTAAGTFPTECAVCHDPHGSPYDRQLRFPINNPDPAVNLCMRCHNRGALPPSTFTNSTATTTQRGAHAPQGPILLGTGTGYIPAGFVYDTNRVFTTHASIRNPRLCAGCHVNRYQFTDTLAGNVQRFSTGHLFLPIPCKDANGLPTDDRSCDYAATSRIWVGCTASGCHASADVASTLIVNERQTIKLLADQLWTDDGVLNTSSEPYLNPITDTGYLPTILAANPTVNGVQAFNSADNVLSPAEGALFNVMMLAEGLYSHRDGSLGVHNPFFYEALLSADIQELELVYAGVVPAPPAPVQNQIQRSMLKVNGRFVRLAASR